MYGNRPCVAISSSDPAYVASSHSDKTIRLWSLSSQKEVIPPLEGHKGPINSITFSPIGIRLVSGSEDKTIRLWDVDPLSNQLISRVLRGHSSGVESVAFSPDGTQLVSASEDRTIWLWDAYTYNPLRQFLGGHTGGVTSVAFAPDHTRIVSVSRDKTIRLWDILTGKQLSQPFDGHTDKILSVAFSPEGSYIVSSSETTVRLWDASSDTIYGLSSEELTRRDSPLKPLSYARGYTYQGGPGTIWDIHRNQVNWDLYERGPGPAGSGEYAFLVGPTEGILKVTMALHEARHLYWGPDTWRANKDAVSNQVLWVFISEWDSHYLWLG
ncbi:hypothetical protein OPQ81_002729 [Rhizoctonia solani]|nr:hypothetical protein OPQ81_002729 [Rhizoctonia solani]